MNIYIPDTIVWMIKQMNSQNEELFLVGGCVRDLLLNREINDYDLTSSMPATEMMNFFLNLGCKVIPTGIKHGTITVIYKHQAVEITTYRTESTYINHRSPKAVSYTKDIKEDLKRRDFTFNAMAYHPDYGLIDEYNGQQDLHNHIIRCVGNPNERFQEDALRILRALRFSAQLNFTLDCETHNAILQNHSLLNHISRERIRDEFNKLLLSDYPNLLEFLRTMNVLPIILPGIECIYDFEQHSPWHLYDVFQHTDIALNHSAEKDLIVKLAIVLHDLGKTKSQIFKNDIAHYYGHANHSEKMAKSILQSLKYPNQVIHQVTKLIKYHDTYVQTRSGMRKLLFAFDNDFQQLERLLQIQECDDFAKVPSKVEQQKERIKYNRELLKTMKAEHDYFDKKDLQVNGNDMIELGFRKEEIKEVLNYLFGLILKHPENNTKEKLMTFAINYKHSQNNNSQFDQRIDYKD